MAQVVCEWGIAGIEAWAGKAAAFVIVDVLSFSTCVSVALDRGAEIIPFALAGAAEIEAEARRHGAIVATRDRTLAGRPSLSPESLKTLRPGDRLLLPSPNGSRLSLATGSTATFCACLRNAGLVARAAEAAAGGGLIAVIAAGEQWPDGSLRPAIEDWLGAGAVIHALGGERNAEARLACAAYSDNRHQLSDLIRDSGSGRELIGRGFEADVAIALEVDAGRATPRRIDGIYADVSDHPSSG